MFSYKYLYPFFFLVMCVFLVGCKEKDSYSYFMHHPTVLKQKLARCQAERNQSGKEVAQCEIIMYAVVNLTALAEEQQEDPQKFGERILRAQMSAAQAKNILVIAKKKLDEYEKKRPIVKEQQAAQAKLDHAKQIYQVQKEDVKVLLAVMSMATPE
jgi:hypothetical protein